MRRISLALALVGFASLTLWAARPSRAEEASDPGFARVGAALFHQYCASCHGANGEGDGPVAADLKKPPANLTRIAARRGGVFPDAEIARFIDGRFDVVAHGTREMPVWGRRFSESVGAGVDGDEVARGRVAALVEYLQTIQGK